jgi:hypothetical protein
LLLNNGIAKDVIQKYNEASRELVSKQIQFNLMEKKYFESLGKLRQIGEKEKVISRTQDRHEIAWRLSSLGVDHKGSR